MQLKTSLYKKFTGKEVALMQLQNCMDLLAGRPFTFSEQELDTAGHGLRSQSGEGKNYDEWLRAFSFLERTSVEVQRIFYKHSFLLSFTANFLLDASSCVPYAKVIEDTAEGVKDGLRAYYELVAIVQHAESFLGHDLLRGFPDQQAAALLPVLCFYHSALERDREFPVDEKNYIELEALHPSDAWLTEMKEIFRSFPDEAWWKGMDKLIAPSK